jgi:hypothetical protein
MIHTFVVLIVHLLVITKDARYVCIKIIAGQYFVRFSFVPLWNIRHKSLKHGTAASVPTSFTGILITGLCHN